MRAFLAAAVLATTTLTPVYAGNTVSSETREELAITIYNSGLALVRDSRFVNLAAGRSTLAFEDVSASMMPQTAALSGALSVIEQNFDFDLLSPQALLNKAVGEEVLLYRQDSDGDMEVRDALVLSNNGGASVLQVGSQIEVIGRDFPGRIVFKKIPANLKAKPTLSMEIDAQRAGDQKIELAYLTNGISWSADYVGKLSRDETSLDLTGLITLTNNTGIAYTDAKTQLIAGDVNRASTPRNRNLKRMSTMAMADSVSAPQPEREAVGDYHMYTLPQPTTIANKQTKQVTFLTAAQVPVEKIYSYGAGWFYTQDKPQNVSVSLEFENEAESNLGLPLPKGVVRIYGKDSKGNAQFLGEDRIAHTAEGNDVELTMGKAFDVTVTSNKKADDLVSKTRTREIRDVTMEYVVKNAKASDVVVNILQAVGKDAKVLETSIAAEKEDAQTLSFDVPVPAKGETVLRFKVRVG
jgi:hypothetical protein